MTSPESPLAAELPVPLTHFVGRERELDDLARLLGSARLLTLTGAGGSGKTRLAREAAAHVAGGFERIAWTDLGPLGDASLIAQQVAGALHLPERTGVGAIERVVGSICELRTLLVLDNCEHLVDACAELVEQLLRACPRLVVLATSREALGVAGEMAWLVPPLARAEARQLFADRAQASCPALKESLAANAAVDEICRRLDGIPLAIELAAARVRVLSPEQIAARLDDAFRLLTAGARTAIPRHRTLRATMEWSHALLTAREQALLRRLAVFAGSFALDAAEEVCAGDTLEPEDILDGVAALVDKSLVVMESGESVARYRLLETVRQYALERLEEAGETASLQLKHARHFLAVVEATEPHLFGGEDEPGIIARLVLDNDNLRAAAAWTVADASRADPVRVELALRFAGASFWYWYGSAMSFPGGQFREGRTLVERALAIGGDADPRLRARALTSCGLIALATGEYEEATRAFGEALALVRGTDPAHEALLLAKKGATRLMAGDLDRASELLQQASAIVEPMPRSMLHAFVWFWHGWTALARGDIATARAAGQAHLQLGHTVGHRTIRGHSHTVYGRVELAAGRREEAYEHFVSALPFHLDLGDAWGIMLDLEGFAAIAAERHRHADAARLLGASDVVRERTLLAIPATERAEREARVARLREALGADELERLLAEGRNLSMDEAVRLTAPDAIGQTAEFRVVAMAEPEPIATPTVERKLRVLALGPLQVWVGDRLVEQAAWGSARPRELLAYLLMHPEGRTKEQAGLAFWPDASPTQLRNNFHVTLHRLRKALGTAEWVELVGDRYRIDPDVVAEFDVVEFEKELTSARLGIRRQAEGAAHRLEQALARYRGDFLDGEPVGDWHLEHRERLQRMYVDSLMELGSGLLREERHDRAAEAYRRVLARDELHEEALVALMRCHAGLGERSQALRVYRRFADRLKQELEAEPGREAARWYERLQQGSVA